jgi:hypothetical protein
MLLLLLLLCFCCRSPAVRWAGKGKGLRLAGCVASQLIRHKHWRLLLRCVPMDKAHHQELLVTLGRAYTRLAATLPAALGA